MGPLLVIRSIIFSLSFLCVLGLMSKMNDVLPRATSKNPSKKIRQQRNNENRKKMTTTKMVFFWLQRKRVNKPTNRISMKGRDHLSISKYWLFDWRNLVYFDSVIYVILILIEKHDLTGFLYPKLNFKWVPLI